MTASFWVLYHAHVALVAFALKPTGRGFKYVEKAMIKVREEKKKETTTVTATRRVRNWRLGDSAYFIPCQKEYIR
jgi:hypothetical protein